MKTKSYFLLILLFIIAITKATAQTYYPLPTQNAYWTVYEWDENRYVYDDLVYTVDGDTLVNGLNYTKVYQLNDHPTIYDTIKNLHCLMRQDVDAKKIWFIRTYLGETTEKLGYDLSVNVGDTISLPAFSYQFDYDSVFFLGTKDTDLVNILPDGKRTYYGFSSIINPGRTIGYIEGITSMTNTFPDRYYSWDPFHQSFTICAHQNNAFVWPASSFPIDSIHCGFNLVSINKPINNQINIYPNPAYDYCLLDLPLLSNNTEVTLIDLLGKPVYIIHHTATKQFNLDLTQIPTGIYLIRVKTTTNTFYNKLIINH